MHEVTKEFLDKGYITKEGAARLEEFEGMLKEANILNILKGTMAETAKTVGPAVLGSTLSLIGADYLTNRAEKKQKEQQLEQAKASFGQIMQQNEDLRQDPERASKKFHEIAHFSPTFASHPELAAPLVRKGMDQGLDEKDVRNLVQIEHGQRQVQSMRGPTPTSAKILQEVGPGAIQQLTTDLGEIATNPEFRMKPMSSDSDFQDVILMLRKNKALPPELSNVPLNQLGAKIIEHSKQNPKWYVDAVKEHGLLNEYNKIVSGQEKKASSNELSIEKKAEILADQYLMVKSAAPKAIWDKLAPSLMGLGAAALFGGVSSAVEQGADYARTKKMNEQISTSWRDTQRKLKDMSEEGSPLSSGMDYKSKANVDRAREAFKVLSDVAPSLAANPTVATPFVNRVVQQEGDITPDVIKQLSEIQKNINTSRQYRSPFADAPQSVGFGRGFESAGGKEFVKGLAKATAE